MQFFDVELIARICHAANSEWEFYFAKDFKKPLWDDESEQKKYGYRNMVRMFSDGKTEQDVHAEFVRYKISQGWAYGERDFANKRDPYLVPFQQLVLKMQLRYVLYRKIVLAFCS